MVDRKYWQSYLFRPRRPVFIWCVVSRTCTKIWCKKLVPETCASFLQKFLDCVSPPLVTYIHKSVTVWRCKNAATLSVSRSAAVLPRDKCRSVSHDWVSATAPVAVSGTDDRRWLRPPITPRQFGRPHLHSCYRHRNTRSIYVRASALSW